LNREMKGFWGPGYVRTWYCSRERSSSSGGRDFGVLRRELLRGHVLQVHQSASFPATVRNARNNFFSTAYLRNMYGLMRGGTGRGGHHGGASNRGGQPDDVYSRAFGSLMNRGATVRPVPNVYPGNDLGGLYIHHQGGRGRWTFPYRTRRSGGSANVNAFGWSSVHLPRVRPSRYASRSGSVCTRDYYDRRERVAVAASESGRGYPFPVAVMTNSVDEDFPDHTDVYMSDGRKIKVPTLENFGPQDALPRSVGPVRSTFVNQRGASSVHDPVSGYFTCVSFAAAASGISYPVPVSSFSMGTDVKYPGHIDLWMSDGTLYKVFDLDEDESPERFPPSLGPVQVSWTRGTADDPHVLD
jgi:hypothetical protein